MNRDTTIKGILLADDNGLVIIKRGNINPAIAGICTAICKHGILSTGKTTDDGYGLNLNVGENRELAVKYANKQYLVIRRLKTLNPITSS